MALTNTQTSWGSLARAFHWLIALLILSNIGLGLYAEDLPRGSDAEIARLVTIYSLHKTLGIVAFLLAAGRIAWALTQPRPGTLHPERRFENLLAEAVHWSLYGAMVVMPLSGWIGHAASEGFAPILWPFGQSLPFVPKSPALAEALGTIHWLASKLLILSILLHLAGAVKHALLDRDGLLSRMVTGRPAGADGGAHDKRAPIAALAAWGALIAVALTLASGESGTEARAVGSAGGNWAVADGTMSFTVKQMQTEIEGQFTGWSADITYDDATRAGQVAVSIPLSGMSLGAVTDQAAGPEFFDVANHPTAVFTADIADIAGQLQATGTLTLRGKEVPVVLPFTLTIEGDTATMAGEVTLDRRDFGMGPSYPDETTVGFAVGIKVALTASRTGN